MPDVTIKWRAIDEESGMTTDRSYEAAEWPTEWRETILDDWADCRANGESAVGEILRRWFTDDKWTRWYPGDQTFGVVVVEVDSPPSIAGKYGCSLSRVVHPVVTALA